MSLQRDNNNYYFIIRGEIYYDNARTINTDEIPDFDLLVGGFPCVAFSAAGRRLAFKDERGTLFFELARILEAKRPAFFVFENVPPKGEHSGVFVEDDGVYPVINPDREKIRQNGPRIRVNGAPAFCITVVDRHGIMHKGRIRRLVPQECFRLMGFTDEQFFELINKLGLVDSKLYKLAGNSIMVPILVDILIWIMSIVVLKLRLTNSLNR